MLARASTASALLTANSRISRGRINPSFAKYARTIRSAMRDPEISPWQSSCFRRPRWQGSARWPGSGRAGGGSGGGGGRRTRTSVVGAGLAMRTCQEQRLALPSPPPLLRTLIRLPALPARISPDPLTRVSRSSVPRVLILASRLARVAYNRSLFLIYLVPLSKSKTDRAAICSTGKFVTAVLFALSGNDCLANIFTLVDYGASTKVNR